MKCEVFPAESGLAVHASLRCCVFHNLELGLGIFYREHKVQKCFCHPTCFHLLSCVLFSRCWCFVDPNAISNRGLLWDLHSRTFLLRKSSVFLLLCRLAGFFALGFSIEQAPQKFDSICWGGYVLVLLCFVSQQFVRSRVFIRGFSIEVGLRCSGALFFNIWRSSVFKFLVVFGVVFGCLWVWSGRPGPGTVFAVLGDRCLGAQDGHMDFAQTHKNNTA